MKTLVRFHGLEHSTSLRQHAARRIRSRLGRFARELSAVAVRIGDLNGPKGGLDKRCRITVQGPRVGAAVIDGYSGDAWSAVDQAVERAARRLSKVVARVRRLAERERAAIKVAGRPS